MMTGPLHRTRPGADAILAAHGTEAVPVGPGIWMSEGLSNSYLVSTDADRVIINAGTAFESLVHRQLFDAVDTRPTRYILVTQGHPDHFGGIGTFREPATDVVVQANWSIWAGDFDRLLRFRRSAGFAWGEKLRDGMAHVAARFGEPLPKEVAPDPTIVVDDHLTLEVGGRRFELYATPGGETTDSMVVWLPDERICFTGNLFGPLFGHLPNLVTLRGDRYRDPLEYLESLERVRALGADTLITGHFGPIVGAELIDDELGRMAAAVRHLDDETVRGMNAGWDVPTLMRDVTVPPELEVGEGYGKASWNVRAIREIYGGWFHRTSTTELYATSPASVHGDLVELAGGPAAVVDRAAARLDAGDALEAIHLAEIALTGNGETDGGAHRVLVDAHRALLETATNFWERAWLEREITRYGATSVRT